MNQQDRILLARVRLLALQGLAEAGGTATPYQLQKAAAPLSGRARARSVPIPRPETAAEPLLQLRRGTVGAKKSPRKRA